MQVAVAALLNTEDLTLLHTDLLAAYDQLLPRDSSKLEGHDWARSRLPQDEPYIWEHIIYHRQGAGDGPTIVALVTDLAYLAHRRFRSGPYAAESDLQQAAQLYPDDQTIDWLARLFTQWGHARLSTVADVGATLWSRTHHAPPQITRTPLAPLLPRLYLEPRWGLREAPAALQRVLEGHTWPLSGVAFSPDGTLLATASADGTVALWDPGQRPAHRHPSRPHRLGERGGVLARRPQVAAAGYVGTVALWDPASGQLTATLEGHASPVNAVAFSPNGTLLATASDDRTVGLWEPASGQRTATLKGHTGSVNGVWFSPDGTLLATASDDETAALWDPDTGQRTATLTGHTSSVYGVAFSPYGTLLATASGDGQRVADDPSRHGTRVQRTCRISRDE